VVDPRFNLQLDSSMRAPRTDEFSVGVDREVGRRLAVALAYIRKDGSNFIGWTDVGGHYRHESRTLNDGRSLPVFALVNSPSDRRFLLTNQAKYSLTYNGLSAGRRLAPIRYRRRLGRSPPAGRRPRARRSARSRHLRRWALRLGATRMTLTNAPGRLPNDRPHMLRVMTSVDVPRTAFVVAANMQHFSGKPWAATAQVSVPQNTQQRVLFEPRGSRRLPSQTLLGLRLSRTFSFRRFGRIDVLVDVLNLLDDTAAEDLVTDNLFSPSFAQPAVFMDPRRVMVGVRMNVGQ
jgi:hypothetical protein